MLTSLQAKPWLDEPEFRRARGLLVTSALGWVGLAGSIAYALSFAVDASSASPSRMLAIDGGLSVLFAAVGFAKLAGWVPPRHANAILAIMLGTASIGFAFSVVVQPHIFASPGFLILLVGAGLLLLSWPGFVAVMATATLAWFAVGSTLAIPLLEPLVGILVPGIALGGLMHVFRYRTYRNLHAVQRAERERTLALAESEERWRGLIENMPETFAILDREGRMEYVHTPQVPHGTSVRKGGTFGFDHVSPDDAERLRGLLHTVFEEGRTLTFEMPATGLDGAEEWYSVSAGPIRHGDHVAKAMLLVTNITERRRTVEALHNGERLSGLGTLVAGVAHEINNPLSYIRGNLELTVMDLESLLPAARSRDERETLETSLTQQKTALQGIDQIAHITRSLKRVARSHHGVRTTEDPNVLVDSVLVVATPRLTHDGTFHPRLDSTRHVTVDTTEISQVLLNLVFNAIDAVANVPQPRIDVHTWNEPGPDGGVRIDVTDNGTGIADSIRSALFLPFQTTKPDGTGLGLSISRRIVNDHGGTLTFDTTSGVGTTFSIRLPPPATPLWPSAPTEPTPMLASDTPARTPRAARGPR